MTILHVIRHGHIGGCESHLLGILKNLDSREIQPIVIALSYGDMVECIRDKGLPCYVLPYQNYGLLTLSRQIHLIALQHQVDLVHAHDRNAANACLYTTYQQKTPMLYGTHCWSFHQKASWFRKLILRNNERYLVRHSKMNIAASEIQPQGRSSLLYGWKNQLLYHMEWM
ncbi:MAG: glycosyltransferase family 4 protein [Owenweeksia sp.]|nr:glycosyltransferase family 4 protein [Owenweeksia sp.]